MAKLHNKATFVHIRHCDMTNICGEQGQVAVDNLIRTGSICYCDPALPVQSPVLAESGQETELVND